MKVGLIGLGRMGEGVPPYAGAGISLGLQEKLWLPRSV